MTSAVRDCGEAARAAGTIDLPTPVVGRAMRLAAAVHDYQALDIADLLATANRWELNALCVTLAAMVDIDKKPSELLGWNDGHDIPEPTRLVPGPKPLKPHGTHSAFARHKKRGEQPCPSCIEGERTYQRLRKRRNRGQVA